MTDSTETLRRAAALMRKRAEAATPGRWGIENRVILVAPEDVGGETVNVILGHVNQPGIAENERNAQHIASWHPAVALAVADWLERAADDHDDTPCPAIDGALAFAHAYLGESA